MAMTRATIAKERISTCLRTPGSPNLYALGPPASCYTNADTDTANRIHSSSHNALATQRLLVGNPSIQRQANIQLPSLSSNKPEK